MLIMRISEMNKSLKTKYLLFALIFLLLFSACKSKGEKVADNGTVSVWQNGSTITLEAPKGSTVYYTTDGSIPDESSTVYEGPFEIQRVEVLCSHDADMTIGPNHSYSGDLPAANVIRAVAVGSDGNISDVTTVTCFEEKDDLITFSIITDYSNLLDYENGIMVRGKYYDEWTASEEGRAIIASGEYWFTEGNFSQKGKDWERPAIVEIHDGGTVIAENCGIRIKGGTTRTIAQKSFNIYFRNKYGIKELEYPLFDGGPKSFSSFTLRNGGNDSRYLKFRDAWIQDMVSGMDFTTQLSRPAIVYINGEYWGIYTLQEKYCEEYFRDHFGTDDVIMIKESEVDIGEDEDIAYYEELLSFADRDLADPDIWNLFKETVDIDSMADYFATEVYIGNYDLNMDTNFALWRSREKEEDRSFRDGRWRFVLYDTEFSSGIYGHSTTRAETDHLGMHMESFPIFAAAMKNREFRRKYNDSILRLQEIFSDENVRESLQSYAAVYGPHMERYHVRFDQFYESYEKSIDVINSFFSARRRMDMTVEE